MEILSIIYAQITTLDLRNLKNSDILNFVISLSSLSVALLSLVISLVLLGYTVYQYLLKRGEKFYGIFAVSNSVWSNQRYVSDVIIENYKDKSAIISTVYLKLGGNIFIELVDYSDSPKILGPFETLKIALNEGVSGYISSTFKVDLDPLLADRKVKKSLIVATPKKIYVVKKYKKFWNVYFESLRNHLITPVRPVRKYYAGAEYSDALQFIITDATAGGGAEKIFLYSGHRCAVRGLEIKVDDFSSADELKKHLADKINIEGLIVEVVSYNFGDYKSYDQADIVCHGLFFTSIFGRIHTKLSNYIFKLKNSKFGR